MNQQNNIERRVLPIELVNELFSSMPLENSFGLLAKMPNGVLARNVQKMVKNIKEAMKNNKLNKMDCGPKLSISLGGLVIIHQLSDLFEVNCVRTVLPIPSFNLNAINKPIITFYYEGQILNNSNGLGSYIWIGLSSKQFPLKDKNLGWESNSIGIRLKEEMFIEGDEIEFGNDNGYFMKGDLVGIGIICHPNSSLECFSTWNGHFQGKARLQSKFGHLQLFPTALLAKPSVSIRLNFGKEEWQFKEFGHLLK